MAIQVERKGTPFSTEEAKKIGESLGIGWKDFDVGQFRMGLNVELEHGLRNPKTNITNDDPIMTGKIALAHLNELPNYYTLLNEMERTGPNPKVFPSIYKKTPWGMA